MKYPFQKVSVIDDNEIDRYIITSIVNKFNFSKEVIEFNMAQKALTYLEQNQNNGTLLPEIIFLDINMPEMSGFDFLDHYQAFPDSLKKQIQIFILTSSNNPDDSERAAKNPLVSGYIHKPLNVDKLNQIILQVKKTSASVN
ncbi:MAG: response regulator [Bacteroidia bacterium]|nr:response regulator [Bacteroidia bacterium]